MSISVCEKKVPWNKSSGEKNIPEKAFSVEGMPGKSTEGSWTFFKQLHRLHPPHDPHINQAVENARLGTFFRDFFFGIRWFHLNFVIYFHLEFFTL